MALHVYYQIFHVIENLLVKFWSAFAMDMQSMCNIHENAFKDSTESSQTIDCSAKCMFWLACAQVPHLIGLCAGEPNWIALELEQSSNLTNANDFQNNSSHNLDSLVMNINFSHHFHVIDCLALPKRFTDYYKCSISIGNSFIVSSMFNMHWNEQTSRELNRNSLGTTSGSEQKPSCAQFQFCTH